MAPVLRVVTLLACSLAALAAAQGTVKPANTDGVEVVTKTPTPATPATPSVTPTTAPPPPATPAATPYVAAPIPEATEDSPTFRKVPNANCTDDVAELIQTIYTKNRLLFDTCAQASKYQIFPFSGKLPTQDQIYALATTKACTALFTACVLADLPQCDITDLGLKSVVETLLKVTVDIDNGKPTPDTMRFHYMHIWRRDSNLAQAAGLPYGNDSQLYREYSTNLWKALTSYNVKVKPDLSIEYNVADITSAMHGVAGGAFSAEMLSDQSLAGSASQQSGEDDEVQTPAASGNTSTSTKAPATSASVATTSATIAIVIVALMSASVATL